MLMRESGFHASRGDSEVGVDPRLPVTLSLAVGFAGTMSAAAALTLVRGHVPAPAALAVMTVLVGLIAWWSTICGAVLSALVGWLMLNGFAIDQYGVLAWHGPDDLVRIGVLLAAAVVVALTRAVQLEARDR